MDNSLQNFDISLFHKINHDWVNSFFDYILPIARESVIWVPLYLFLIIFGYINFGKKGIYWIVAAIITVVITNYISSNIIKETVGRLRPCQDSMLDPAARLLISRCPTSGSFTSSHAANHFALATFIFITLKHIAKWASLFFVWAFIISYAQIYVGVHYPVDIIGGTILGISIAYIFANYFNFKVGLLQPITKKNL